MLDILGNINNLSSSIDTSLSQSISQMSDEVNKSVINITNNNYGEDTDDMLNKIGLAIQRQGGQ